MAYGVVRTDSVKAIKAGGIKSGRYYVSDTATAIDNGCIVKLDSLISGERDLWKVVAPGDVKTPNCYLVATPEIVYSEELKSSGALDAFQNAAGANITLIPLEVGDTFSISDDCITPIDDSDDLPAVGSHVAPAAAGVKWAEVASIAQSEVFYGKIIARELYKAGKYLNVVEMVKVR
jgi:hypothetical protein